ncbi:MAG: hypothetical protein K5985_06930 [Lachnospiraceae bacterium]|nr:hypothetical protein [Lachnospiraceae bacterium]
MKKYILPSVLIFLIALTAFLKFQTDDELYYGLYDFTDIPEGADLSDGVITLTTSSDFAEGEILARIPLLHVPAGSYRLLIDHEQDTDSLVRILNGGKLLYEFTLPAGETESRLDFSGETELYSLSVEFLCPGGGTVSLKHAVLYASRGFFYTDTLLLALFLILLVLIFTRAFTGASFREKRPEEKFFCFALAGFAVLINYPLFTGYIHYGGDITYHISRIEGIKNELINLQVPVRLFTGAFNGRGLTDCLYPDLFLYIPAFLRLLGASVPFSYHALLFLINLGSMGSAYVCARSLGANRKGAALAMVLYACLPYRLSALYFRDALGEALAMVFLPLVIAGLYEVFLGDRKRWWLLTLGLTGVIESHVLSAVMAAGLAFLALVLFFSVSRLVPFIISGLWTLFLNLWFIVPFLYYHGADIDITGKFAAANFPENAVIPAQLFMSFAGLGDHSSNVLAKGIAGEDNLSLALAGLICLGLALFRLLTEKKRDEAWKFLAFLTGTGVVLVVMSISLFPWGTLLKFARAERVIRVFQFPLRFLQPGEVCLLFAGISALFSGEGFPAYARKLSLALGIVSLCTGIFLMDSFLTGTEHIAYAFYPGVDNHYFTDYTPVGFDKDALPDGPESDVKVEDYLDLGLYASFKVDSTKEGYVVLPKTFYPVYSARVKGENGGALTGTKGEGGMLRLSLPAGSYEAELLYSPPVSFPVSFIISLLSSAAFLLYLLLGKRGEKG